jgi:hypothetical protein
MDNATAAIEDFVTLAITRRRGDLPISERPRIEALESVLRDLIDGAHPAPRKIENPTAVSKTRTRPNVAPASIKIKKRSIKKDSQAPSFGPSEHVAAKPQAKPQARPQAKPPAEDVPEINLSAKDEAKVTEVNQEERPSGYTPSVSPCYLDDYYSSDVSFLSGLPSQVPTKIKSASSQFDVNLRNEEMLLLGLGKAEILDSNIPITLDPSALEPVPLDSAALQPIEPAPSVGSPTSGTAPSFGPSNASVGMSNSGSSGALATIHLASGGSKRGTIENFDPSQPTINLVSTTESETLILRDILAIFFQGDETTVSNKGSKLVVTLANDREVAGISPDYAPGVSAMHIVPHDHRGQTSYIWVPAWAVKAIRFA